MWTFIRYVFSFTNLEFFGEGAKGKEEGRGWPFFLRFDSKERLSEFFGPADYTL